MIQANFAKLLRKMISIAAAITIKFAGCSRKKQPDDQKERAERAERAEDNFSKIVHLQAATSQKLQSALDSSQGNFQKLSEQIFYETRQVLFL